MYKNPGVGDRQHTTIVLLVALVAIVLAVPDAWIASPWLLHIAFRLQKCGGEVPA